MLFESFCVFKQKEDKLSYYHCISSVTLDIFTHVSVKFLYLQNGGDSSNTYLIALLGRLNG